jgi:hypothetical protein
MPKLLSFPERFGIIRSRTGCGTKLPPFNDALTSPRTRSTPTSSIRLRVSPSTPGVCEPAVALHPLPRSQQRGGLADEVEQIAEALVLILVRPTVQLGLPSQYPLLAA